MIMLALQSAAHSQPTAKDKAAKIDEVMTAANKYRLFNGSVLVAENGKVIYKKGLGLAQMEWNIPNAPDTKFRLGSITKQFTATLILQLGRTGKGKARRESLRLSAGLSQGHRRESHYPSTSEPHLRNSQLYRPARLFQ